MNPREILALIGYLALIAVLVAALAFLLRGRMPSPGVTPTPEVSKFQKTAVAWGERTVNVTFNNTGQSSATLLQVLISENFVDDVNYTSASNLPLTAEANACVTVSIDFNYTEGELYRFRFVCTDGEAEFLEAAPTSASDSLLLIGASWRDNGFDLYLGCITQKSELTLLQCLLNSTDVTALTNLPISLKSGRIGILKVNTAYERDAVYAVEVRSATRGFNFTVTAPPAALTLRGADVDEANNWIIFMVVSDRNLVVERLELSADNETFVDVTGHSSIVAEPFLRTGQTSVLYIMFPNEFADRVSDEGAYYARLTATDGEMYYLKLR